MRTYLCSVYINDCFPIDSTEMEQYVFSFHRFGNHDSSSIPITLFVAFLHNSRYSRFQRKRHQYLFIIIEICRIGLVNYTFPEIPHSIQIHPIRPNHLRPRILGQNIIRVYRFRPLSHHGTFFHLPLRCLRNCPRKQQETK